MAVPEKMYTTTNHRALVSLHTSVRKQMYTNTVTKYRMLSEKRLKRGGGKNGVRLLVPHADNRRLDMAVHVLGKTRKMQVLVYMLL